MPNFQIYEVLQKVSMQKLLINKISYLKNNNNSNIIIVSQRSFPNHKDNNL